jgi:hypothetical protein
MFKHAVLGGVLYYIYLLRHIIDVRIGYRYKHRRKIQERRSHGTRPWLGHGTGLKFHHAEQSELPIGVGLPFAREPMSVGMYIFRLSPAPIDSLGFPLFPFHPSTFYLQNCQT